MTEDEAKTKACCGPFAGRAPYAGAAEAAEISKQGIDPDYIAEMAARWPCLGSACMAWRETKPVEVVYLQRVDAEGYAPGRMPAEGYCGLAGPRAPQLPTRPLDPERSSE